MLDQLTLNQHAPRDELAETEAELAHRRTYREDPDVP
jgi:hypothetical protein